MASWIRAVGSNPKPTVICSPPWNSAREEGSAALKATPHNRHRPSRYGCGTPGASAVEYVGIVHDDGAVQLDDASSQEQQRLLLQDQDGARLDGAVPAYAWDALPPSVTSVRSGGRAHRIVVISDTHEHHRLLKLPPGDILIHCGDILSNDRVNAGCISNYNLKDFFDWFNAQPFSLRICIAGNHDHQIAKRGATHIRKKLAANGTLYLENTLIDVGGLRIFGTPRSTANSATSGNTSFQSDDQCLWPTTLPDRVLVVSTNATDPAVSSGASSSRARAAVTIRSVPRAELPNPDRLDFLLTHGAPCDPAARRCVTAMQPAIHLCGHAHDMHGLWVVEPGRHDGNGSAELRPVEFDRDGGRSRSTTGNIFSLNASIAQGSVFKEYLSPPIVFDYLVGPQRA